MVNTIALLIPVFFVVVLIEGYISYKKRDNNYTTGNTMMNLAIGAIDQVCSLFYFGLLYFVLDFVYHHWRIVDLPGGWLQWVLAYIAVDFLSYWYHRFSHRVNFLWAGHVTHHSSEHFNFTNGFRTSVFQGINRIMFWSCLPVFGFSPLVLLITLKVSGIYDFLLHSSYIPKLGFLEKILITPSLHRVHHGRNAIYIDKNYGSTFLVWDQLFGTYQEETEKVEYGIKSPYVDNNPFTAIGHHYRYLWQVMRSTPRWADKLKVLVMPPEWKPPVAMPPGYVLPGSAAEVPAHLRHYAWFQVSCCISGLIVMLVYKDFITEWELLLYSCIGLTSVANSAMIFNANVSEHFMKRELFRLTLSVVLILGTLVLYAKVYLLAILFFVMLSLTFASAGLTHKDTHVSRQ